MHKLKVFSYSNGNDIHFGLNFDRYDDYICFDIYFWKWNIHYSKHRNKK